MNSEDNQFHGKGVFVFSILLLIFILFIVVWYLMMQNNKKEIVESVPQPEQAKEITPEQQILINQNADLDRLRASQDKLSNGTTTVATQVEGVDLIRNKAQKQDTTPEQQAEELDALRSQ